MTANPRSVVFIDLDHTLLEGPFESVVFPQILGEISRATGLAYETLLQQVRRENLDRLVNPDYSPVQAMDWDDIFTCTADRLGVRLQSSALELVNAYLSPPYIHLHEGACEALEALASDKPRRALVLATKGLRKYQLPVLDALELARYFDEVLTPDSSLVLKQSPAFYGRWPKITRLQIMVGDNYQDDVLPAHGFGFKTVWVNRQGADQAIHHPWYSAFHPSDTSTAAGGVREDPVQPDATIASLAELAPIIDRFEHEAFSA